MKTGICDAMNAMRLIAAATASSNSAAAIGSQRRSRGKLFPRSRVATGKTVKASKHSHGLFQPERAVRSNDPVDRPGRKHQAARQRSTHPGAIGQDEHQGGRRFWRAPRCDSEPD